MIELDPSSARRYLADRGIEAGRITALGGGVSNVVLLVETSSGRFVLKQSLGKLRVAEDWFSDRARIFREGSALRVCGRMLASGAVPEVLFEDREHFAFAMSAASASARTWKELLLGGQTDDDTARCAGEMLGRMVAGTRHDAECAREFGDLTIFDQLRLDPYYRSTAARHPDLAHRFEALIEDCRARRVSLVHGDWSPKNFLVDGSAVMAIDFEVCHFGNPAFDSAFLLNHLLLKSFYRPRRAASHARLASIFWQAFSERVPEESGWLGGATLAHLGGLLLARIDGKSPAEYIRDEGLKQRIRGWARRLLLDPPERIEQAFAIGEPASL